MNILTDSIWYFGHLENLEFVNNRNKLFKYIHNKGDMSGKVNVCWNQNVPRNRWSKAVPLVKYLLDKKKITADGHYYVNHSNGEQYSIFYKDGVIYPFSDCVCSEETVHRLKKIYKIEDSHLLEVKADKVKSEETIVNKNHLITIIASLFVSLTLFTVHIFIG